MAARNMTKILENFEFVPERYDMSLDEMMLLRRLIRRDSWEGIYSTFKYGFILGTRYEAARRKAAGKKPHC